MTGQLLYYCGDRYGTGRCPVCGENATYDAWVCPSCNTPHHEDCIRYNGGCGVFGCRDGQLLEALKERYWPKPIRTLELIWQIRHFEIQALLGCTLAPAVVFLGACLGVPFFCTHATFLGLGGVAFFGTAYILLEAGARYLARGLRRTVDRGSIDVLEVSPQRLGAAFSSELLGSSFAAILSYAGLAFGGASLAVGYVFGWRPFLILAYISSLLLAARIQLDLNKSDAHRLLEVFISSYRPGAEARRLKGKRKSKQPKRT